jgi:hypothetical protein
MALRSKFKLNAKLQACSEADKDHIGESTFPVEDRKGPHVALIHEALNAWAGKQKPSVDPVAADEVIATTYGSDTARLVSVFKTRNKILNYKGQIDAIVGIKTVAALDLELPELRDPVPVPPQTQTVADIVVRFQGAFEAGPLTPDSVLSGRRIVIYQPMPKQPFGNKVMLHPFNGRTLLRLGQKTTTIGDASLSVFGTVLGEMNRLLILLKLQPGKIFIHGSSSGGRNAIDFAARITRLGLKPLFVAAVDAAFFQADTNARPEANVDRPRTIPEFPVNAGSASKLHNFFQTLGNHAKRSLRQSVVFTSNMAGEEIHGAIAGFRNNDLTRLMPSPLLLTDDQAHGECGKLGSPEAERLIADELLAT